MSNSSLVSETLLSPNHSGKRKNPVTIITPHCFVGQVSLDNGLKAFQSTSRKASCNYLIAHDGRIGLCVDEENRSWCSSSAVNDNRAVTIEIASDSTAPYAVKTPAMQSLIELMADICKRNGKTHITWIPDKSTTMSMNPDLDEMLISVHRWFANKACPGDYIYSRLPKIAEEVNKILKPKTLYRVQVGAFSNRKNAERLEAELKAKGYQTIIKEG